jgi:uncharacterized cupredoxin-like copper-binding protein
MAYLAPVVSLLALVPGLLSLACGDPGAASDDLTIGMRYSKFTTTKLTVKAGVPATFTLRNDDPIGHEWIVGGEATHQRHRTGTEPYHDTVPTEVTIAAYSTKTTTITFERPGTYVFICHLPGHEEYGMRGVIRVIA